MIAGRRRTRHRKVRGGDENDYDNDLLFEAKKPKLFDVGARLRKLKPLASDDGVANARKAAVSDLAKKILGTGGRRRHTRRRR